MWIPLLPTMAYHLDKEVVGIVGIKKLSFYLGELKHLYVSPSHRRKGIATALINKAVEEMRLPAYVATVLEGNEASLGAFNKAGFKQNGLSKAPFLGRSFYLMLKVG